MIDGGKVGFGGEGSLWVPEGKKKMIGSDGVQSQRRVTGIIVPGLYQWLSVT